TPLSMKRIRCTESSQEALWVSKSRMSCALSITSQSLQHSNGVFSHQLNHFLPRFFKHFGIKGVLLDNKHLFTNIHNLIHIMRSINDCFASLFCLFMQIIPNFFA